MQNVLNAVSEVCGGQRKAAAYYTSDDLESDIIASLWMKGGFTWELERVRAYAAGAVRNMLRNIAAAKVKPQSEFTYDDGNVSDALNGISRDDPFLKCCANEADELRLNLPRQQAEALGILAEGGTPIDVSNEMHLPIKDALLLISEARRNIHLVAGHDHE